MQLHILFSGQENFVFFDVSNPSAPVWRHDQKFAPKIWAPNNRVKPWLWLLSVLWASGCFNSNYKRRRYGLSVKQCVISSIGRNFGLDLSIFHNLAKFQYFLMIPVTYNNNIQMKGRKIVKIWIWKRITLNFFIKMLIFQLVLLLKWTSTISIILHRFFNILCRLR